MKSAKQARSHSDLHNNSYKLLLPNQPYIFFSFVQLIRQKISACYQETGKNFVLNTCGRL